MASAAAHAQTLPEADIDCVDLPDPKLFIEAGDTQMTMLGDLARALRDEQSPLTLVYLPRSSCTLAENVFKGNPTLEAMRYVPSAAEAPSWDGTPHQCRNRTQGFPIDLGIAATFVTSCSRTVQMLRPDSIAIFEGPVQAYGFVVPEGSLDAALGAITQEEAYYVFSGQGPQYDVVPWNLEANPVGGTPTVYIRQATTSTLLTLASNVAPALLPASSWVGYRLSGQQDRSSVVISGVANAPASTRDASIGILGVDLYDRARDRLDMLAYRAAGQHYAYYPDSTPARRDKRNVRDGHYVPWAYTEYLTAVDANKLPLSADVQRVLDLVSARTPTRLVSQSGTSPAYDIDAMEVLAKNGLVPDCAMRVRRAFDGGDLSLYAPEASCGCFFETIQDADLVNDPAWSKQCVSCSDEAPCAAGVCNRGFCEAGAQP
ncbi:MAG: hypothetical protein QM756_42830 [Polyangiaceae bacterium]